MQASEEREVELAQRIEAAEEREAEMTQRLAAEKAKRRCAEMELRNFRSREEQAGSVLLARPPAKRRSLDDASSLMNELI